METSFGLFFFLKKPKGYKEGEIPVYMRLTVDGVSCEISTKRKVDAAKWNVSAGRMIARLDAGKTFNGYLDTLQQKLFEAKRKLLELDLPVTCTSVKNKMLGIEEKKDERMVLEIFAYHNKQMNELVGKDYAAGTMQRFETALRHTRSFIEYKYGVADYPISKLDFEFIKEYEFWLKSVRNCDHNTTMKYLANFKKIVIHCIKSGWLVKDPFMAFKMTKREVDRVALTEPELKALVQKNFGTRLKLVRDIFLFSCFTGLAYADVKKLKRSEVTIGNDGEEWIVCKRQKTDVPSHIPLLPMAKKLLDEYYNHPQCIETGMVLPVHSNQKMNAYLKEIADICGLNKELTYHIARHTFATTVTLSNGMPIETVSKMLGHRNLKTTQHYAKILNNKIGEDMKAIKDKWNF